MWGYYGSKQKLVNLYPEPKFNTIIEPFAGTAQYSLKYWDRNIILIEKNEIIYKIWKWLQICSPNDIRSIRQLKYKESVDDFSWSCQEEKWLIGFTIGGGLSHPKKTPSKWKTILRPNTQTYRLNYIADNLYKIKHWDIRNNDYKTSPDIQASWFIDPPYTDKGKHYKHGSKDIDYQELSCWCKNRKGQVIVCEAEGARWLDFKPLVETSGNTKNKYTEVIYTQ
jgi:hypothetical protein